MRLLALFSLLLLYPPAASGQESVRANGAPVRIAGGKGLDLMQPRWSPEGSKLAATGPRYQGIWTVSASGDSLTQISDEEAAGFGFQWSPEGGSILARVARYDGVRRLDAVKVFDTEAGSERLLTEFGTSDLGLPRWSASGASALVPVDGRLDVVEVESVAGKTDELSAPVLLVSEGELVMAQAGGGALRPVTLPEDASAINLVYTPDGSRVAFELVGGNMYVMNADGSGLVDLGPGNRPQWSPDGAYVVFMRTEDDGHAFTGAELYAVRSDGTGLTQLTSTPDLLEMNPSWSPDGQWIAYDEASEGAIYLLPVAR